MLTTFAPRQQTAPVRQGRVRAVGNRHWTRMCANDGLAHAMPISAALFVTIAALKLIVS